MASLYFACNIEKQQQKARAENEAILYPNLRPGNEAKDIHIYRAFASSWQNVNIIMPIV